MARTSLGTLGVNIAANAGQFLAELTKAEGSLGKFERSISKTLTKAGLDTIGFSNAARALSSELQHVWRNIENIEGIDAMTIASVTEMKAEVESFKEMIHGLVADGIALFAQLGKSIGMIAAVIAQTFEKTNLKDLFTNPTALATNFAEALRDVDAALQAEFDSAAKSAQVQNELAASTAAATKAKKESAELLALITKQNEEWARSEAANLARMKAQGESIRRDVRTPLEEWADTLTELNDLLAVGAINQETFNRAMRNADLKKDMELNPIAEQITEAKVVSETAVDSIAEAWNRLGVDMTDSMGRALLGMDGGFRDFGDSVKRMLQEVVLEMIKVELQAMVLKPIIDGIKGAGSSGASVESGSGSGGGFWNAIKGFGKTALKVLGFADGGRPPVGVPSMVGERGPELFVPDAAGTIVPNHKLGQSAGPGVVNHYYIDARGTDAAVVNRLGDALQRLAGPGVVEQRALGAVMNYRARGATA